MADGDTGQRDGVAAFVMKKYISSDEWYVGQREQMSRRACVMCQHQSSGKLCQEECAMRISLCPGALRIPW